MTEPIQQAFPGTDVPSEVLTRRRGRPPGARNRKLGSLFSDGQGDYRLYVAEDGGMLTPVTEAPGFLDAGKATVWLRANGGREDLLGRSILVIRAMHMIRIAMAPLLQFKPRPKVAPKARAAQPMQVAEPEPAST